MTSENETSDADPAQEVSGRVLADKERNKVLFDWNATATDYPREQCIHQLFEARVAVTPEAVAVVYEDQPLSYAELNARANRLAHYLIDQGVGPDTLVALCLERSLDLVVAVVGILKAGGAYVPLDPGYPQERLAFMLEDTRAPVLITQVSLQMALPSRDATVLCLDNAVDPLASYADKNPAVRTLSHHLAYINYTSGSTGQPKGVAIPHQGVTRLVFGANYVSLDADKTLLHMAPISFDAATFELWGALLHGGRCVLYPERVPTPEGLKAVIAKQGVDTLFITTALFNAVMDLVPEAFKPIKQLLTGGEAHSVGHIRKACALLTDTCISNIYGPTESTTFATHYPLIQPLDDTLSSIPIGRPVSNTQVYILDANLKPVPIGVVGELYIGGDGLARGYLNRPELTAECFIPNPLPGTPGERLYKTGDLVRYRADGAIEFMGRSDDQVKIRGFRIEPGEIEVALRQHPQVQDGLVLVREEGTIGKHLVAYVVTGQAAYELCTTLRDYLKKTLPEYMVPSAFITLDAFPLTPNGKVDKKALPAPDLNELAQAEYVAPRNEIEKTLIDIWSEVLGLDPDTLSIDANFFELGGHSLLAEQLLSRTSSKLQKNIKLSELYDNPTIKLISRIYNEKDISKDSLTIIPTNRKTCYLDTSFSQDQVIFLNQLNPDSIAYNFAAVIEFTGHLDIAILEGSLSEIIRRHEIFRTTFTIEQGVSKQVIHDTWHVKIPIIDLEKEVTSSASNAIDEITNAELRKKIAADKLPLVLWTLVKINPEKHLLVHIEHHLVHDGWSFAVFIRELKEIYSSRKHKRDPDLPELPFQFADYAKWQRSYFTGQTLENLLIHWKKVLAPPTSRIELPSDYPRPKRLSHKGGQVRMDIDPILSDSIRKYCKENKVTLFSFLFSVYAIFINRYTRQQDIIIGTGVANRNTEDSEHLIGMFVNAIPVRFAVQNNKYFTEFVQQTMRLTLEAYDYQSIPFELLVKHLNPERGNNYNPIFQTMFSFHDAQVPLLNIDDLQGEIRYLHNGSSKFDLTITGIPWAEQKFNDKHENLDRRVTLLWEFPTDLFLKPTIERMTRHYQVLLEQIVAHPDKPISDYELLTPEERHQLLFDWNATEAAYPKEQCVQQLFEAQVARSPEAVAVVYEDQQLSYAELNTRANRLAHYLIDQGVAADTLVALCLERSPDLVVAVVGILKAGGAYVPLDPGYPQERLAFMLEDTRAPVLLTQSSLRNSLFKDTAATVLALDADVETLDHYSGQNPETRTQSHHLAYVIYTSGSTGQPKGVEISHSSLVNLVAWYHQYLITSALDRATLISGPAFDASVADIWPTIAAGASLYIPDEETRLSPDLLLDWYVRNKITLSQVPTPLATLLIDLDQPATLALCILLSGGDKLKKAPDSALPYRLINVYGPTESTVDSTWGEISAGDNPPSIGRPVSNTQVYILDANLKPVPIGVVGELYIGGDGLARGYLNRPELTAECFIPNPLPGTPGERLYKTGDLVRYRADGAIEFMGRSDDQVKIRGFRIEPGEIEVALRQHPQVQDGLVLVREEGAGGKRLVAYVVGEQAGEDFATRLQRYLKKTLPEYMVPSAFIMLDAFPLTPNGKVDKKALSAMDLAQSPETEYVAPRTPVEEELVTIWCELLQLERVGVHDDFFHLGGHSLLAMQVMSRIKSVFKVTLALRTFFENPTVAEMSLKVINTKMEKANDQDLERILSELEEISDEEAFRKRGNGLSDNIADN